MLRRQIIPDNPARNKGIRSGHQEQIFKKENGQQGIATYRRVGDRRGYVRRSDLATLQDWYSKIPA